MKFTAQQNRLPRNFERQTFPYVMHQTDSAINLVYNLFKELRLSCDLFDDEMYFTCQSSLQKTQHCSNKVKFEASWMNAKTDRKKLKFKYLDSENEERCTIFPVHAMKLHRGKRGVALHSLQLKSGRRWIFILTPRPI